MPNKAEAALINLIEDEWEVLFSGDGSIGADSERPSDPLARLHDCLVNDYSLQQWQQSLYDQPDLVAMMCKIEEAEVAMTIASALEFSDQETSRCLLSSGHYTIARQSEGWDGIASERVSLNYFDGARIRRTEMDRETQLELCQAFHALGMVGNSQAMVAIYEMGMQIVQGSKAPTVLIYGEPGAGKSLLAKALHQVSGRKGSCEILGLGERSGHMFDSAINGHEVGAFTDAKTQHIGVFEKSSGGTVVLDDMNHIAEECCAKLLTVLQERRVRRFGGDRDIDVSDVMVVATANQDLDGPCLKWFPGDLRERLDSGHVIRIPSLAARLEDIPLLTNRYLSRRDTKIVRPLSFPIAMVFERLARAEALSVRKMENRMSRLITESSEVDLAAMRDLRGDDAHRDKILLAADEIRNGTRRFTKTELARRLGIDKSTLSHKNSQWYKAFSALVSEGRLPEFSDSKKRTHRNCRGNLL